MKILLAQLVFAASCVVCFNSLAQTNTVSNSAPVKPASPSTFAQVVNQNFSQWDSNGDSKLTEQEIAAAMSNPAFKGESAAALAAIKRMMRKYSLPPVTQDYLVSSPLRDSPAARGRTNLQNTAAQPEQAETAPAFQPVYRDALRRLHKATHDLFPQSLPTLAACHQGPLGDCTFVSVVGAMIYRDPAEIKAMFAEKPDGYTEVTFGNGHKVTVGPLTDSDIAISDHADTNGLWLSVLENAFRNFLAESERTNQQADLDTYGTLHLSSVRNVSILDGQKARRVTFTNAVDAKFFATIRRDLSAALREHRMVVASTPKVTQAPPGMILNHEYAILGFDDDTDMVHAWNPWGNTFKPKGPDGLQNGYVTKSGEFNIPLRDLLSFYHSITFELAAADPR